MLFKSKDNERLVGAYRISDFIRLFHSSFHFLVPYFTLYSYEFGKICPEFREISVSYM